MVHSYSYSYPDEDWYTHMGTATRKITRQDERLTLKLSFAGLRLKGAGLCCWIENKPAQLDLPGLDGGKH